ncbi:hypothetical protein ACS0TY_006358 [Phlomoides rotata]
MFILACFMLMAYTGMVESTRNVFILAGQSNMVGEGGVVNYQWDGYVPPESTPNPLILRLNDNVSWEEAREPLHRGAYQGTCGIGPGMPFANAILKRNPGLGEIGLVPCAVGGTKLSQWMRGTELYSQMLIRARAAVSDGGGALRALLWYQGESDTESYDDATMYKSRLVQFINDVRSDLKSPSLPVVEVALASGSSNYIGIVRNAQLETGLSNVRCVDANGMERGPDGVHLTTAAEVQVGTMLADAFLQMI